MPVPVVSWLFLHSKAHSTSLPIKFGACSAISTCCFSMSIGWLIGMLVLFLENPTVFTRVLDFTNFTSEGFRQV